MLVLLRHSIRPFWTDLDTPYIPIGPVDLGAIFINGWMGVDLFFVLSGFLISSHLIKYWEKGYSLWAVLRHYGPRRFFRIAPAYYLVLTLAVVGWLPYFPYPKSFEHIGWRYVYHLLFMQDYWPSDIIVVFWSLAIEIKFYLLAPFLIFGVLKLPSLRWQVVLLTMLIAAEPLARALFAPEVSGYEEYFMEIRTRFDWCLDGLLTGVLAAFLWNSERVRCVLRSPVMSSLLFYGGLVMVLVVGLSGPLVDLGVSRFDVIWLPLLISTGFGAMLLGLLGECPGHGWFEKRFLSFIALISYSLYLVHLPVMFVTEAVILNFVNVWEMGSVWRYAVYLPLFLLMSGVVATVLYVFVERPIILWSKQKYGRKSQEGEEADNVGDGGQKYG